MSEEIRQAFMHPEVRSAATAGAGPFDRISLRGYIVNVEIGAFQTERGVRQRIEFNIVVEVAPHNDPDDDVDHVLSYDLLTEAISVELELERINLLETLAERVAGRILRQPRAMRVFIRIEKLDRGPAALGVEIVRSRRQSQDRPGATAESHTLRPTIIYVAGEAVTSARVTAVIDRFELAKQPAIFCVGRMGSAVPPPENPKVCQRICLLAIEQSAWSLSARDRRLTVVDTRTELDWALNNGRFPVWAPSRMVLGAVGAPDAGWVDSLELAAWFAGEMGAAELVTVGIASPTGIDLLCREIPLESVR